MVPFFASDHLACAQPAGHAAARLPCRAGMVAFVYEGVHAHDPNSWYGRNPSYPVHGQFQLFHKHDPAICTTVLTTNVTVDYRDICPHTDYFFQANVAPALRSPVHVYMLRIDILRQFLEACASACDAPGVLLLDHDMLPAQPFPFSMFAHAPGHLFITVHWHGRKTFHMRSMIQGGFYGVAAGDEGFQRAARVFQRAVNLSLSSAWRGRLESGYMSGNRTNDQYVVAAALAKSPELAAAAFANWHAGRAAGKQLRAVDIGAGTRVVALPDRLWNCSPNTRHDCAIRHYFTSRKPQLQLDLKRFLEADPPRVSRPVRPKATIRASIIDPIPQLDA